jgi:hypothetical protein
MPARQRLSFLCLLLAIFHPNLAMSRSGLVELTCPYTVTVQNGPTGFSFFLDEARKTVYVGSVSDESAAQAFFSPSQVFIRNGPEITQSVFPGAAASGYIIDRRSGYLYITVVKNADSQLELLPTGQKCAPVERAF